MSKPALNCKNRPPLNWQRMTSAYTGILQSKGATVSVVRKICYWAFQVLNFPASVGLLFAPRASHESLFSDPQRAYDALDFSLTAQEMLHNVLRGQGAALMTISIFLGYVGYKRKESFLLITLACLTALSAHIATLIHHTQSPAVMAAIGNVSPLYAMIAINGIIGVTGLACWYNFTETTHK